MPFEVANRNVIIKLSSQPASPFQHSHENVNNHVIVLPLKNLDPIIFVSNTSKSFNLPSGLRQKPPGNENLGLFQHSGMTFMHAVFRWKRCCDALWVLLLACLRLTLWSSSNSVLGTCWKDLCSTLSPRKEALMFYNAFFLWNIEQEDMGRKMGQNCDVL